MRRLICAIAGRTYHIVRNIMPWLIFKLSSAANVKYFLLLWQEINITIWSEKMTIIFTWVTLVKCRSSSWSTPSVCPSIFWGLVCIICNSNKSFHSFIFKLCIMIVHTLKMCTYYFVHDFMNIFSFLGCLT